MSAARKSRRGRDSEPPETLVPEERSNAVRALPHSPRPGYLGSRQPKPFRNSSACCQVRGQWGSDFHRPVRGFRILTRQADRLPPAGVIGPRSGLELVDRALENGAQATVTKAVIHLVAR